ncbi:hypothetical protein L596_000375 [Steinernema carpocapsae]|uniref:Uncharacterized protein n=1 Tax=Steinernema carpocapsae TaxID=34508 RepID=A0A4U8UHU6_STECR|nr:hypothetical protein L596_000375 [Steinernema carpocapsae]
MYPFRRNPKLKNFARKMWPLYGLMNLLLLITYTAFACGFIGKNSALVVICITAVLVIYTWIGMAYYSFM